MYYFIGYYNKDQNFVLREVLGEFENVSSEHIVIKQFVSNSEDVFIFDNNENFRYKKILKTQEVGIFTASERNPELKAKLVCVLKFDKHKQVLKYLKSDEGREQIKNIIVDMELNNG
jgi:hypothetical protein